MQINGTLYMSVAPEGNIRIKAFETTSLGAPVTTEDYDAPVANPLNFSLAVTNDIPHLVKIYDSPGDSDGTLLADFTYDPKFSSVEIRANKVYIGGDDGAPVPGESSFSDADLDGLTYWLERRGLGTMQPTDEWDYVDGGGFKLINENDEFQDGDVFTLHFYPKITTVTPSGATSTKFITDIAAPITVDTTLGSDHYNKLLSLASATTKLVITLPAIDATPALTVFALTTNMGAQVNAVIQVTGTDSIFWNNTNRSAMYMGRNEQLMIMKGSDGWYILDSKGGYDQVGRQFHADMVLPNTLERNGALLDRAVYARLYNDYVKQLSAAMIVSEATWSTDATTNRGKYTLGDGSTTFRIPDSRGLFIRNLDSARGIDTGRAGGTYQDDMTGPHTHVTKNKGVGGIKDATRGGGLGDNIRPYANDQPQNWTTSESNDGSETRGKNEAKIALIAI